MAQSVQQRLQQSQRVGIGHGAAAHPCLAQAVIQRHGLHGAARIYRRLQQIAMKGRHARTVAGLPFWKKRDDGSFF